MPDAVQFSVTKLKDDNYKIIVQDEREILRTHLVDRFDVTDAIDCELRLLRAVNV